MRLFNERQYKQWIVLPHTGTMQEKVLMLDIPCRIIHFYSWTRIPHQPFSDIHIIKRIVRNSYAWFQFVLLFLRIRPNFVCTNTITHSIGAIAAKCTFRKHAWFLHELGEEDFGFKLLPYSYHLMRFTTQIFFANSDFLAQKFIRILPKIKIETVYNPVFVDNNFPVAEFNATKPVKMMMIGQISPQKGHKDAIEAMAILKTKNLDITLDIFGRCEIPNYKSGLDRLIVELGLTDRISINGQTNNSSETISKHHLVLVCSICEAMGRVSLEAMKLRVPVIGANSGGTPEIIDNGVTGWLYTPGDPSSLAEKIELFINNPNKQQIIEMAYNKAERLTREGQEKIMTLI